MFQMLRQSVVLSMEDELQLRLQLTRVLMSWQPNRCYILSLGISSKSSKSLSWSHRFPSNLTYWSKALNRRLYGVHCDWCCGLFVDAVANHNFQCSISAGKTSPCFGHRAQTIHFNILCHTVSIFVWRIRRQRCSTPVHTVAMELSRMANSATVVKIHCRRSVDFLNTLEQ